MKKKLLAILLSAAMIFSSLSVYAETDMGNETESMSAVETNSEQGENTADSTETETEDAEENMKENPDLSTQPDTFVSDEDVEAAEEITDVIESAAEESFTAVSTNSLSNYIGEIQVGDTVEKDNVEAGEEYQLIFKTPATGKYRIYLMEGNYDDTLYVTNEQNEVIAPCDEEGYQLTAGQTVVIRVVSDENSYYRWEPLKVRLIDYIGIENVTADVPEYLPYRQNYNPSLKIHYSNGEIKEVVANYGNVDPLLNKRISVSTDNSGNVSVRIGKSGVYHLGKINFLEWNNPVIPQITEEGEFTISKENLLQGKYICLNPVMNDPNRTKKGIYFITVSGDVSNDFSILGVSEGIEAFSSKQTENGVQIDPIIEDFDAIMLTLDDKTSNTNYRFQVRKSISPISMNITLLDDEFRVIEGISEDEVSVRASIEINYEDGSSEIVAIDCKKGDNLFIPIKNGFRLYADLYKAHSMDYGCYRLYVSIQCANIGQEKDFVVFPKQNYKEEYDSYINLTANVRSINVPALTDSDTRIVKIYSQVDCNYQLDLSQDMNISVYEEKDNKLIPCYTSSKAQEFSNRIHFENGKTYYLICTERYGTKTYQNTIIHLNAYYNHIEVMNLPNTIETLQDLENAEICLTDTLGVETRIPLLVNGNFNNDNYPISYWIRKYDSSENIWTNPGINIPVSEFLNYLKTGELQGLKAGNLYAVDIMYEYRMDAYIPFTPKGDGRIVTQPENVTASINNKISFSVNAENAASYQWQYSKDGGTTWSNSTVASAKTDTLELTVSKTNYQNIYRCKVTGKKGAIEYSDSAAINLIPWSEITVQPESPAMINGETVKFHCEATNAASYQWQYSKDGTTWKNSTLSSAKTDTLSIKVSDTNSMNIYRCQVTGIDGNKVNSGKAVFVLLTQQPEPCSAPLGTKASYTIKAENAASYQWQYSKDGGLTWHNSTLTSAKTDTLSFTVALSNQENLYRCKMKTTTGVYAYTKPVGYVDELKIVTQPVNKSATAGKSVTFKVEAAGKNLTYQWQFSKDNGATWTKSTLSTATTASLKVTAQASQNGRLFRCVITDGYGKKVTSVAAKLTVR